VPWRECHGSTSAFGLWLVGSPHGCVRACAPTSEHIAPPRTCKSDPPAHALAGREYPPVRRNDGQCEEEVT
jgi:hypothetical protein